MGTTLFDAMRSLHEALTRAFAGDDDLSDVAVFFGGPTNDVPFNSLHVGYSEQGALAVDGEQSGGPDWGGARSEDYDIALTLYTQTGDSGESGALDAAVKSEAAYRLVESVLQGDPKIGGSVEQAEMGARLVLNQGQLPGGAGTTLQFTIRCLAYP